MQQKDMPRLFTQTKHRKYNIEIIETMELENMIQVLILSAISALHRTESRGVHYRIDRPNVDHNQWLQEIVVKQVGPEHKVSTVPVTVTRCSLPSGKMTFEDTILDAISKLSR